MRTGLTPKLPPEPLSRCTPPHPTPRGWSGSRLASQALAPAHPVRTPHTHTPFPHTGLCNPRASRRLRRRGEVRSHQWSTEETPQPPSPAPGAPSCSRGAALCGERGGAHIGAHSHIPGLRHSLSPHTADTATDRARGLGSRGVGCAPPHTCALPSGSQSTGCASYTPPYRAPLIPTCPQKTKARRELVPASWAGPGVGVRGEYEGGTGRGAVSEHLQVRTVGGDEIKQTGFSGPTETTQ